MRAAGSGRPARLRPVLRRRSGDQQESRSGSVVGATSTASSAAGLTHGRCRRGPAHRRRCRLPSMFHVKQPPATRPTDRAIRRRRGGWEHRRRGSRPGGSGQPRPVRGRPVPSRNVSVTGASFLLVQQRGRRGARPASPRTTRTTVVGGIHQADTTGHDLPRRRHPADAGRPRRQPAPHVGLAALERDETTAWPKQRETPRRQPRQRRDRTCRHDVDAVRRTVRPRRGPAPPGRRSSPRARHGLLQEDRPDAAAVPAVRCRRSGRAKASGMPGQTGPGAHVDDGRCGRRRARQITAQLSRCRSQSRGTSRGPSRPRVSPSPASSRRTAVAASSRRRTRLRPPGGPRAGRRSRRQPHACPARRRASDQGPAPMFHVKHRSYGVPEGAQAGRTTTRRCGSSPSDSLRSPAAATASWTIFRSNGVIGSRRTGSPEVLTCSAVARPSSTEHGPAAGPVARRRRASAG